MDSQSKFQLQISTKKQHQTDTDNKYSYLCAQLKQITMFAKGRLQMSEEDILCRVSEAQILSFYLGVKEIPCKIKSPLRPDRHPSFAIYTKDGFKIHYKDFSTGESGSTFSLLMRMWNCTFPEAIRRVYDDMCKYRVTASSSVRVSDDAGPKVSTKSNIDIQVKIRDFNDDDREYWESYGVDFINLNSYGIYAISHKIIIKDGVPYTFAADRYAYAYIEHKDDRFMLKIYQPFNKDGFKWCNNFDSSVISLWTRIPTNGDKLCICSSVKDALCLHNNIGIPALSMQGEGYYMSDTAIKNLKERYQSIYILFDSDKAGKEDSERFAKQSGFIRLELPETEKGKDVSDIYRFYGKDKLSSLLSTLFV